MKRMAAVAVWATTTTACMAVVAAGGCGGSTPWGDAGASIGSSSPDEAESETHNLTSAPSSGAVTTSTSADAPPTGSSFASSNPSPGSSATVSTGLSSAMTSGSETTSVTSTTSFDAGVDALTGTVQFMQCVPSSLCGATGTFWFTASFHATAVGCSTTTSGTCAITECSPTSPGFGDDAGTLTISGGSILAGTTVPDYPGDGIYDESDTGRLFAPGQRLSVAASGGVVPAFRSESVTAPGLVTVTAPALADDGGTTVLSTATDLSVAWTGGEAGATMTFEVDEETNPIWVTCAWDATLGHGSVPRALLRRVASPVGNTLQYGQQRTTTFAAGSYTITASALLYSEVTVSVQ